MSKNLTMVVTINHLYGCGGKYIGRRLASQLNALYLDQEEIVKRVAQELKIAESDLKMHYEKDTTFWRSLTEKLGSQVDTYVPPSLNLIKDKDVLNAENKVIQRVAEQHSAVIMGRTGPYILRDRPNHLSILLHASKDFRKKRIQKIYNFSEKNAIKILDTADKERAKYLRAFTGLEWSDAKQYHLCLDTGIIGIQQSEEIILNALNVRFGVMFDVINFRS